MDLRSLQKPLKEHYPQRPKPLENHYPDEGWPNDAPIACSVDIGRAIYQAEAHQGVGGRGTGACSGDLLLGALALARRSPVRWWLRRWVYQPSALRSRWREGWTSRHPGDIEGRAGRL